MSGRVGQQALLERSPARSLIVPAGASSWWGVDPSSVRLAVGMSDGVRRSAATISFAESRHPGVRLRGIMVDTRRGVLELLERWPAPGMVGWEQPSGKHVNHPLVFAIGAAMAGMTQAFHEAGVHMPVFEVVASSWWKRVACGRGDIGKPKRARGAPPPAPRDYAVLRWAQDELGYPARSWDEADVLGIVEALRLTWAFVVR